MLRSYWLPFWQVSERSAETRTNRRGRGNSIHDDSLPRLPSFRVSCGDSSDPWCRCDRAGRHPVFHAFLLGGSPRCLIYWAWDRERNHRNRYSSVQLHFRPASGLGVGIEPITTRLRKWSYALDVHVRDSVSFGTYAADCQSRSNCVSRSQN